MKLTMNTYKGVSWVIPMASWSRHAREIFVYEQDSELQFKNSLVTNLRLAVKNIPELELLWTNFGYFFFCFFSRLFCATAKLLCIIDVLYATVYCVFVQPVYYCNLSRSKTYFLIFNLNIILQLINVGPSILHSWLCSKLWMELLLLSWLVSGSIPGQIKLKA